MRQVVFRALPVPQKNYGSKKPNVGRIIMRRICTSLTEKYALHECGDLIRRIAMRPTFTAMFEIYRGELCVVLKAYPRFLAQANHGTTSRT